MSEPTPIFDELCSSLLGPDTQVVTPDQATSTPSNPDVPRG
jgi:hypothetical protein